MPDERYLPRVYRDLRAEHPGVAKAYDALGRACSDAGPLTEREQHLVKLGIAIGLASEGGVRSHIRRGLMEGISPAELLHAIVLAVPTAGFPATAAAYRWARDVLDAGREAGGG
jgi:4-carboxymuconolactone decarboxylase